MEPLCAEPDEVDDGDELVLSCATAQDRPSSRTETSRTTCRMLNLQMTFVSILKASGMDVASPPLLERDR